MNRTAEPLACFRSYQHPPFRPLDILVSARRRLWREYEDHLPEYQEDALTCEKPACGQSGTPVLEENVAPARTRINQPGYVN